ncbi:molybdopterin oxidoreductase [Denitrovibrio acetiphilus DSM 12809]|uniref:Molybdopterin oxidoreductase n=1 Tax=Denitrovibrio acetiphilus (strain DSM 12809 / NBRC 114555 / N2460) TaxID=522772 RepID=D4H292_DENA2|nr:molybdopterin-dependent oxidoreductase [Denitrovibrio acetiphilus]ADD68883.1 molybdopterin oxidoreductase [Denitrovibrio acetiphilus DSM 12809]
MKLRRRDFLKATAAVSTVAMVGCGVPKNNALAPMDPKKAIGEDPGKWISTTCQGCTTWDPIQVFVQDGRAVKVRGNPNSKANCGTCCPRAHMGLQQLYDPDRVKVPMKRTNPEKGRGIDPKFVPITWDEALNTIADKMMELRNNGEAHKYMLNRGRYTYMRDMIYDAMTKIYGSPNNISHSALCAEAEKSGAFYTHGYWDYRDYDLTRTKYLLIWGLDPLVSNRQVPFSIKVFGDVLDKATVTVVDPKLNASAAKAHNWLPVLPGTDGALAVAIAHVLLTEDLWHKPFVGDFKNSVNQFKTGVTLDESVFEEKYTNGIIKWWNIELKDKTPEWAEQECGISAEVIYKTAREMAAAAPSICIWMGPGAAMQVRGTYTAMAIESLCGLLGNLDNIGGTMMKGKTHVNKMPKLDDYKDEVAKIKHKYKIDQRGYLQFPALNSGKSGGGVVTNNLADGILQKNPMEIKMGIGYMNNFAFSGTGAQRWEEAMSGLEFYVHITTNASEMTQFADIVLPSAITTFEKWGYLKSKGNLHSQVSLLQPVVEPLFDVRTDETEIPFLIAEKLAERGFDKLLRYYKEQIIDPETGKGASNAKEFAEIAVKYYTAPSWDGKKDFPGDKIKGWEAFKDAGVWNDARLEYKKSWGKFKTVTKKFEFYSETLKKALKGHADKHNVSIDKVLDVCNYEARGEMAFVPHYEAPFRYGSFEEYPFTFIDHKSRLNKEGRSANTPWYQEFKKVDLGDESWDDVLKINPDDAAGLGIKNGDMVRITSTNGSFTIKAKFWEGLRPGTVTKCYGQGHWAYGRVAALDYKNAKPRGFNNNELMPCDYDRISGSTARNGGFCGVKIEKV